MEFSLLSFNKERERKSSSEKKKIAARPQGRSKVKKKTPSEKVGGFKSFVSGVSNRRSVVKSKTDDSESHPLTAPDVFNLFREKMLKKHPGARLPIKANGKDLKRVKDVVLCYDPETISKMIDVLIIEWDRLSEVAFPPAKGVALPTFDYLYHLAGRLSVATTEGITGWGANRGQIYKPETGEDAHGWLEEKLRLQKLRLGKRNW